MSLNNASTTTNGQRVRIVAAPAVPKTTAEAMREYLEKQRRRLLAEIQDVEAVLAALAREEKLT